MALQKMGNFSFNHKDQQDDLYKAKTATEIKTAFDSRGEELKSVLNALIDKLESVTDGDSGADNIKATTISGLTGDTVQALLESLKSLADNLQAQITENDNDISNLQSIKANVSDVYSKLESLSKAQLQSTNSGSSGASLIGTSPITGVTGSNVQAMLESLKSLINQTVLGQIPDGSITEQKLAFDPATQVELDEHKAEDASLTTKGHVQLSSATNSTSETLAATPKAVKDAYDLANQAFTQANDIKGKWAGVVGSPLLSSDTSTVLESKTQTIKNDLATNLTAKGQSSVGTETLAALVAKVANVNTGKKWATGTFTTDGTKAFNVNNLTFKPAIVVIKQNVAPNSQMGNIVFANIKKYGTPSYNTLVDTTNGTMDVANISVSANGFSGTTAGPGGYTFTWIAIEE